MWVSFSSLTAPLPWPIYFQELGASAVPRDILKGNPNLSHSLQETPRQRMICYFSRKNLHVGLQKTKNQSKFTTLHAEHAPAFLGDPKPLLKTPPPDAEPALHSPSVSAPDIHHQHTPPPKTDFPSPVIVFIWLLCNFVVFFHIVYSILYFGF